jgi:hypothetical protein
VTDLSIEHQRGLLGPRRIVSDSAGAPRRVPIYPTLADTYRARTAKLVAACTIDRSYDQPWLANRSTDGSVVYIDRRVPRILKCGIDTDKTLPVHELSEFLAMNDGLRYDTDSPGSGPTAHNDVATPLERQAVEAQKPNDPDIWKKYTEDLDGYIREVDDETITHVAPDQDLRQFAEDDRALLRKIIATERNEDQHYHIGDAGGRHDPTGTASLRAKFRRDLDAKWLQVRRLILSAFAPQNDILGLCTIPIAPDHAGVDPALHRLPGSDRVVAFRNWLEERERQLILTGDGRWVGSYLNAAIRLANKRAEALTGTKGTTSPHDRIEHMTSLAASELSGICAAFSQRATRALAHGLLSKQRPDKIAREIATLVDTIGKTRGRMLVNYAVVKAFNGASLDAFRQAGFKKVGTIPEKLRVARGPHGKHLVRDEARITPQRRHGGTGRFIPFHEAPTPKEREAIETGLGRIRRLGRLDILTAGDDAVCFRCEEASDDGPYSIDDAEGLLPIHVGCRCAWVPVEDERFAPVIPE